MLITLRYQDELRPARELDLPADGLKAAGVSVKEIALAKRLVDDMTERWNPGEFKDTYHDDLMARIKQKIKQGQTKEITQPGADDDAAPRSAKVIDLAELLKRSLGKGGARKPAAAPVKAEARARPALRVVAGTKTTAKQPAAKRTTRSAARKVATRKRA
jgi:DNA end-binding protein Ku